MANTATILSKNMLTDGTIVLNVDFNINGVIGTQFVNYPSGTTDTDIMTGLSNTAATIAQQKVNLVTSQTTFNNIVLNSEIAL